ncbi:hypothetical protein E4U39_000131 [Claviceps sp. Clav50 group G5]|nr:hypothetical protein E4U39_000131 [Claviceps sp. Clav50 group G5]
MTESAEPEQPISVDELTPEEASRIIHSHRKVRYVANKGASSSSSSSAVAAAAAAAVTATQKGRSRKRARSSSDGRDGSREAEDEGSWPGAIGISASLDEYEPVGDRYLGQNSIPALLREQSSPNEKNDGVDVRHDMRSILGLDTSAPFPLMSSQHLQKLGQDISAELPSDREVMKLFRTYKEIPQPFWGFVYDIDDFEARLMVYLEDRSRNASGSVRNSQPVAASWLGTLFAVLAVASQYHESPYHVRTRDSQKYIQISIHFLRLGNFLLRPSFDSIQALLLTSFVLLNDMKAEASWALTGLTCRLAQSLGLHRATTPSEGRNGLPPDAKTKQMIRRRLWWTCVWHDTLTSLSFDRCPMTNFPSCEIPISQDAAPAGGQYTYLEMMYHLIEIISRRLNPDATAMSSYTQILDNCAAVEQLRRRSLPHMQDKEQCRTALDRLQYFAIRLHTSFVISVACRPALKRTSDFDPKQKKELADRCKDNLTETVRMFLAMHQLSVIPTRSWAFTYHGLSSALLLGIMCETKTDPEIRQLQGDLIDALSATAAKKASPPEPHIAVSDKDIELSGPLWRALTALKNIYEHGFVIGSVVNHRDGDASTGGGSGTRTPLPSFFMATQQSLGGGGGISQMQDVVAGGLPPASDAHKDAALAMAELQNGATLHEFSGLSYARPTMPVPMNLEAGLPGLMAQQTHMMAPMDLYDSIWGESPDPWNDVDGLNFDFIPQPPPGQPHQQYYF